MEFDVKRVKIFVTVPKSHTKIIRDAVCSKGAGVIGNYTYCSTTTKSIGTFIPNQDAHAYIGKSNKLEVVKEDKLEFVCDVKIVKEVLNELKKVHPYEEPAIDIIHLLDESDF